MTSALLSFAYTAAYALVFLAAFRCLSSGFKMRSRSGDRTGLRTTHPELLDENGLITKEELLVVHFGGFDGNALPLNS